MLRLISTKGNTLRSLVGLLLVFQLVACTKDVTRTDGVSGIVNVCYRTLDRATLGVSTWPLETPLEISQNSDEYYRREPKAFVGEIERGTEFKVIRVNLEGLGEGGHCWNLEAMFLSGPFTGAIAALPTCFLRGEPLWINLPRTMPLGSGQQLLLKPEYVAPCD